jgi:hypothetical protein
MEPLTGFINLQAIELYSEYNLLAKILTVGVGHELCDRAWQLGLLTVYAITALAVSIHIYHKKSS